VVKRSTVSIVGTFNFPYSLLYVNKSANLNALEPHLGDCSLVSVYKTLALEGQDFLDIVSCFYLEKLARQLCVSVFAFS